MFLELGLAGEVSRAELLAACPAVLEASREGGLWRLKVENPRAALGQAVALAEARDLEISDVGPGSAQPGRGLSRLSGAR